MLRPHTTWIHGYHSNVVFELFLQMKSSCHHDYNQLTEAKCIESTPPPLLKLNIFVIYLFSMLNWIYMRYGGGVDYPLWLPPHLRQYQFINDKGRKCIYHK